jgi:hypothetical protein
VTYQNSLVKSGEFKLFVFSQIKKKKTVIYFFQLKKSSIELFFVDILVQKLLLKKKKKRKRRKPLFTNANTKLTPDAKQRCHIIMDKVLLNTTNVNAFQKKSRKFNIDLLVGWNTMILK